MVATDLLRRRAAAGEREVLAGEVGLRDLARAGRAGVDDEAAAAQRGDDVRVLEEGLLLGADQPGEVDRRRRDAVANGQDDAGDHADGQDQRQPQRREPARIAAHEVRVTKSIPLGGGTGGPDAAHIVRCRRNSSHDGPVAAFVPALSDPPHETWHRLPG